MQNRCAASGARDAVCAATTAGGMAFQK
jgi:hypothetical protein